MIILVVDTSGDKGTIAIGSRSRIFGEISLDMTMSHLPKTIPTLDYLLHSSGMSLSQIDILSVVTGPGSWSGIRIGVTLIKSIAHVLNKPIVPLCSLDVLAFHLCWTHMPVYTLIDAARKQIYYAIYSCKQNTPVRIHEPELISIQNFSSKIDCPSVLIGNGVLLLQKHSEKELYNNHFMAPYYHSLPAMLLVKAGFYFYDKNFSVHAHDLIPLYLQQSDAERNFDIWQKQDLKKGS